MATIPDQTVVVRGGLSSFDTIRRSAEKHQYVCGEPALSAWAVPGCTAEEVAIKAKLRHRTIRATTAGALRAAGFPVVGEPGHVTIQLPCVPTREVHEALDAVFGPPQPNPVCNC